MSHRKAVTFTVRHETSIRLTLCLGKDLFTKAGTSLPSLHPVRPLSRCLNNIHSMKTLLVVLCWFACTSLYAQDKVASLMQQGDAFDASMKTAEALKCFLEAEKLQPKNADLLHRIAKQYGESMNDVATEAGKRELAKKALDAAQRAVAADANNPLAQVALAISYGRLATYLDNETKIAYTKLIKQHADKALALDPKCELAYHVLGAWNYELADFGFVMRALAKIVYGALPEASYGAAETSFKKAIELNPQRVANFVELGRTYVKLKQTTEARKNLEQGIRLPSVYRDDEPTKTRARQELKDL